jgi:hypothetical protein
MFTSLACGPRQVDMTFTADNHLTDKITRQRKYLERVTR